MELEQYLNATGPVPADAVLAYMGSTSLPEMALARHVLGNHWARIAPPIDLGEAQRFLVDFYVRCMVSSVDDGAEPISDEYACSRYDAAHELARLCEWIVDHESMDSPAVKHLVQRVTQLSLVGDRDVRLAVETGFLEHVFERSGLVPLFEHWKSHADLSEAFNYALKWGAAHQRTSSSG